MELAAEVVYIKFSPERTAVMSTATIAGVLRLHKRPLMVQLLLPLAVIRERPCSSVDRLQSSRIAFHVTTVSVKPWRLLTSTDDNRLLWNVLVSSRRRTSPQKSLTLLGGFVTSADCASYEVLRLHMFPRSLCCHPGIQIIQCL